MGRKSIVFYVFVSFFIISLFGLFFTNWIASPLVIILFAIIFKYIIGTQWKDSFKLGVLNYIWIIIFNVFFLGAELIMSVQGQSDSGKEIVWAFFLMVIGIPLTTISINWKRHRHFDYSFFDNLMYKHRINQKTVIISIIVVLVLIFLIFTTKINYLPFISRDSVCESICMSKCSSNYGTKANFWDYSPESKNCDCGCTGGGRVMISPN